MRMGRWSPAILHRFSNLSRSSSGYRTRRRWWQYGATRACPGWSDPTRRRNFLLSLFSSPVISLLKSSSSSIGGVTKSKHRAGTMLSEKCIVELLMSAYMDFRSHNLCQACGCWRTLWRRSSKFAPSLGPQCALEWVCDRIPKITIQAICWQSPPIQQKSFEWHLGEGDRTVRIVLCQREEKHLIFEFFLV